MTKLAASRVPVRILVVALLLAAIVGGAWWLRESRRPSGFILISIDTLRADHLGAYGYPLDTSPFFDELAERGTLFENAIVQLPGTLPSHMSMFTGLYPAEHGVYPPDSVLSGEIPTLPEVFRAAGYRTAGFTEGGYVEGHYGFERGFDTFRAVNTGKPGAAGRTFGLVHEWIDTLEPGDDFFLFVHTYEVHDPYIPMEGYGENSWPGEPPEGVWEPTGANLTAASNGKLPVTPEYLSYFGALYDAGIRYVDDVLRAFMEHLWAAGLSRDTTVVITSDHGEEFLEHGSFVHRQIYRETLHVPLLVRRLGQRKGARVRQLVESVDLAPTFLELAGLSGRMDTSGTSLVPLLDGDRESSGSEAYAEGMSVPTRSIYKQTDSGLYQLLLTQRLPVDGRLSAGRKLAFDWTRPTLTLSAASVGGPGELEIWADGARVAVEPLTPEAVHTFEVVLPEGVRKHAVELRMAGCEGGEGCSGFFLEGFTAERRELYRIDDDPRQQNDLSAQRPALVGDLEAALDEYRWEVRAAATQEALSDEQTERLKALGYLQ